MSLNEKLDKLSLPALLAVLVGSLAGLCALAWAYWEVARGLSLTAFIVCYVASGLGFEIFKSAYKRHKAIKARQARIAEILRKYQPPQR